MERQTESRAWHLTQPPQDHLRIAWPGGRYETARRGRTGEVEGRISPDCHLVMVTLDGGADYHSFRTDDGFRYQGRDTRGMVSFLPGGCNRDLVLRNVAWEWGAVALDPAALDDRLSDAGPFLLERDDFIYGMAAQMRSLLRHRGSLDTTYCSTMALALSEYLANRLIRKSASKDAVKYALTGRQLRDTYERIDAWIARPIAIADLARPLGISEGHFFRAFRGATGQTPLQAISVRRMDRAATLLSQSDLDITEIAARCGIESPSHFARLFRRIKGHAPSTWRRHHRSG